MPNIKTLVFDTETNGKRPKGNNMFSENEPALVQLAAVLYEGYRPVAHMSCFVNPIAGDLSPAEIPKEKFFIDSGITQEVVDSCAVPLNVAIAFFNNLLRRCDRLVAHNMAFDYPVIVASYIRANGRLNEIKSVEKYCTMKTLEPVLQLPGKYGFKFPSLDESYRAIVDKTGFEGAHDAMVDVEACAAVLRGIESKNIELYKWG